MISGATDLSSNDTQVNLFILQSEYDYLVILYVLVITVSMLLNGGILLVIVGSPRLRKQHNIFTFNMALIDLTTSPTTIILVARESSEGVS